MNIFITTGTLDYLKSIERKYPEEKMITMANGGGALLLHETNGATIFNEPRKYEVLEAAGEMNGTGFVVMNNIPVSDEGRPLFEKEYKNRAGIIETDPGFIAIRILRPLSSNTYVTLTVWESEKDYQNSKDLHSFFTILNKKEIGIDQQPKIFSSEPYINQYTISE